MSFNSILGYQNNQPNYSSTYLSPELYLLIELEIQSTPSPKSKLLAFLCVAITLIMISCGLFLQFSELQSISDTSTLLTRELSY